MLHFFLITDGRKCANVACGMREKRVGCQVEQCEACQRPLISIRRINWINACLASSIMVLLSFLTQVLLQQRAAEREVQLLAQGTARFQDALRGATASDVNAILLSVQTELQLTDEQRQQILKASSKLIDSLPRILTADVQQRLEVLIRDLYKDGRLSANDQSTMDQFTQEHRLAPQALKAFAGRLTGRLDEAYRNISEGRSLAGQGKYEEARLALARATQIDPGNAIAWANLGALHALLSQNLEARFCYDKALSLDPENWLAHYNLGLLAARNGDRESAFQHLERALSTLPPEASQEHRGVVEGLLREPGLEELRSDPRFADLLGGGARRSTS